MNIKNGKRKLFPFSFLPWHFAEKFANIKTLNIFI